MKILITILTWLMVLLGVTAGIAKVMQVPQEVEFLMGFGLTSISIVVYGAFQIAGGILMAIPKTRVLGAGLTATCFFASVILVFLSGNLVFALISILPVIISVLVIFKTLEYSRHLKVEESTS
jgi:hypothetical protein